MCNLQRGCSVASIDIVSIDIGEVVKVEDADEEKEYVDPYVVTEQVVSDSTATFEEDVVKVEDVDEEIEYVDPYVLGVPEAEILPEKSNDTSSGYGYQRTNSAVAHLVLLMIAAQQLWGVF